MRLKKSCFIGLILAVILSLGLATPVMAVPQIPHAFYGNVTIGGEPASDGTVISAKIDGTAYATTTTVDGKYGYSPAFKVSADDPETTEIEGGVAGETIQLYIANTLAAEVPFQNGEITPLNLAIDATPPTVTTNAAINVSTTTATLNGSLDNLGTTLSVDVSFEWGTSTSYGTNTTLSTMVSTGSFSANLNGLSPSTTYHFRAKAEGTGTSYGDDRTFTTSATGGGGDGGGGGTPPLDTNLFGQTGSFNISSTGIVLKEIKATSADGRLTIDIPKGTKALNKYGNPLSELTAKSNASPPAPPEGSNVIGLAYDFGPAGATFQPGITFSWSYDPAALPKGIAEEDLVIAYYDATAGKWIELTGVVDTANNKIIASVTHFTTFSMLGTVTPATTPPATTPPATTPPATTPPATTPPATTPPATTPPATTPPVTTPPVTTPTPTPTPAPMPAYWWYIIGIAVVFVIGVIIFLVRRRRG